MSDPLETFMARLLADPAAQARLVAHASVPDFVAAAVAQAAAYGIALPPGDLEARLQPDPLGLSRFADAPINLDRWPGPGWLPARSVPYADPPAFDWAFFGDAPLTEPLYADSVRTTAALPFNRLFRTRTSLAALIDGQAGQAVTPPTGLVFHMSRCGSTLAGRMLRAAPGHAVASEPEPLDAVLQWATLSGAPHEQQVTALRAIVAALGRERSPGQRRFFIKFDAWHVLLLPLVRAAFPDVPWIFLYRDPVEVIMSHQAEPGLHFVPGMLPPALIGFDTTGWISEADYTANVLARICGAVIEHWPLGGGMVVPFDDIHAAMTTAVPAHFGLRLAPAEVAAMTAATAVNAKRPSAPFAPDSAEKQKMASSEVVVAAKTYLAPYIALLDRLCLDSVSKDNYS